MKLAKIFKLKHPILSDIEKSIHPGDLPDPGIKPTSFMSLALAGGFFTISTTWEAHKSTIFQCKIKIKLKIKKKESRARSRFEE